MSDNELIKQILILEDKNNKLENKLKKYEGKSLSTIAYILINIGLILALLSILHTNQVAAIIGISLTFWGGLLLYIKPTGYVRKDIIDSINLDLFESHKIALTQEHGLMNTLRYISPKNLHDSKNVVLYIEKSELTSPQESLNLTDESRGSISFRPLGLELSKLLENELNTNLLLYNLESLRQSLGKGIVDNLEMAKSFTMEILNHNIKVTITGNIFQTFVNEIMLDKENIFFVDPLTSSIACIIAIVSRKSTVIETYDWSLENNILTVIFKLENLEL